MSNSHDTNQTLYGILGLTRARELFGSDTRLAQCGDRFHPSDGTLRHIQSSEEGALVLIEPPFLKRRPEAEFDEYYDGTHGWN